MDTKTLGASLIFFFLLASAQVEEEIECTQCSKPHPLHIPTPSKRSPKVSTHVNNLPVTNPPAVAGAPEIVSQSAWGLTSCSLDILKLGLCLDVLGGLVHLGLGNPVENYCCPVLQGLLELEAAVCLCTAIRLQVLNLNIYIPIALNVLITCGKDPPPGYLCQP